MRAALAAGFLSLAAPVVARDIPLRLPVDCTLRETCHIQQYVDRDPGPGAADYACGPLVYDGHEGTDFALATLRDMENGVDVVSAAPGVVLRTRDGMPDIRSTDPDALPLNGQDCGNGLVIDHGGGWETQYCHLREGSVAVNPGDRVTMGQTLGLIGLSGRTEFPHVEFIVRRDGEVVDPFDTANNQSCGGLAEPLWLNPPQYQAGGILDIGIAAGVPEFDALKAGYDAQQLSTADPLVAWVLLFGGRAGDVIRLAISDSAGRVLHEHDVILERTQVQLFRASGRRAPPSGWAAGTYTVRVQIIREGALIDARETTATVGR